MNTGNPVIELCTQGIQAEMAGNAAEALDLYMQAWNLRMDDYDACVAAHYIARHQESPQEMLRWNQASLDHARAVNDSRVLEFYPSLYLNMGRTYELLGQQHAARDCYALAGSVLENLGGGPYNDLVRNGVAAGLRRTSQLQET
ncbi:MAG: hypothetical protein ABI670_20160 [Chloroflexota bacterium]